MKLKLSQVQAKNLQHAQEAIVSSKCYYMIKQEIHVPTDASNADLVMVVDGFSQKVYASQDEIYFFFENLYRQEGLEDKFELVCAYMDIADPYLSSFNVAEFYQQATKTLKDYGVNRFIKVHYLKCIQTYVPFVGLSVDECRAHIAKNSYTNPQIVHVYPHFTSELLKLIETVGSLDLDVSQGK